MTIKQQLEQAKAELHGIKADDPNLSMADVHRAEALHERIGQLEAQLEQKAKADRIMTSITGTTPREETMGDEPAPWGTKAADAQAARKGHAWATKSLEKVARSASGMGLKSLFNGALAVDDPIITEYSVIPEVPTTLLDLIPVVGASEGSRVNFLRMVTKDDNAAPVAMGDTKPTSVYTFEDDEYPFEVIAHLSEPLNNVWAADYPRLVQIVGAEMAAGVRRALEAQVLNGTGTSPQLHGILGTTGVTQVAYATDMLTTLRRAYTVLAGKGEAPTGYVLHPEDAEAIELMRADGATGQFLDVNRVFPVSVVQSFAVPKGTALLADWRATQLTVREDVATLAFHQHAELAAKNQFIIRSEGRYEFHIERPQAVAVVDLTAA